MVRAERTVCGRPTGRRGHDRLRRWRQRARAPHRPSNRTSATVVALRSLPDDAVVLIDALDAARHLGGTLDVLHGVPVSFGERSVGREQALGHR
jgi:hypothetical protein